MLTIIAVIAVCSVALVGGALWGVFGRVGENVEAFAIALAGGALTLSVVLELIEPALDETSFPVVVMATLAGGAVFTWLDHLVEERWGEEAGGGLMVAITLDGVPENLALGVALISAGPIEVAALAGSILLANFPEAAGGARRMAAHGLSRRKVMGLWAATAVLLGGAALLGNLLLAGASPHLLAAIKCFAGGAVVASLATEVFPKAFAEGRQLAGIATTVGLLLALGLNQLAQ